MLFYITVYTFYFKMVVLYVFKQLKKFTSIFKLNIILE